VPTGTLGPGMRREWLKYRTTQWQERADRFSPPPPDLSPDLLP
jgi:hypothetical protein